MRIALPVSIIFSLFEKLSDLWVNMQNQVILMSKLHDIMISLEVYTRNLDYNKEWLDNQPAVTDAERLEKTANCSLKSTNEQVQVFRIENFQNIDKVRLQFLGSCCWKFVETDEGLIPGNPSMGIVKYKNLNYVFSTPEACESFSKNPDRYIRHVLDLGRRKPQLINFLQLKDQLEKVMNINQLVKQKKLAKGTENKGTILENIFPVNIDPKYKWNRWDYKREALMSTQTMKSDCRNTMAIQTYPKQTTSTQTKRDCYTNIPKPSTFIFGLRGRKDDKQFLLDLTQDIS
ncbi:cilia- and flagella-associated protein 206-like [Leptinotarsa decemlineata]|uniref:cilia- and flagella-associated protein 206-like n=1 Tax=Leptinotarsa decemlineata TaxID=7539 RepID=UPI003D30C07C